MDTARAEGKKALVIGAGIGGLCTAIALQAIGWQVEVFEQKPELAESGAGIVLAANAMKALTRLGAADAVRKLGQAVGRAEIRTPDGSLLVELPVHEQARRYGTPSYLIHRALLQAALYSHLDAERAIVHWNSKLVGWKQDEVRVTAELADGTRHTGDVLIGADGVHSAVRAKLFGGTPLRYSGFSALRGIANYRSERYPMEDGGGFEAWGTGKRFGFSHLGEGRVFWFAAINGPEGHTAPQQERKRIALSHFRGWFGPIEAVIEATDDEAILAHDIYDRKPLASWHQGRVTLLGDAAHPMLPNLGQGGAQAMEDALALARSLGECTDVPAALLTYERGRMPRTARVARQSRQMARIVQLEHPLLLGLRNGMLRMLPAEMQLRRLHWLLGYEV